MRDTAEKKQITERLHLDMLEKLLRTTKYGTITLIVQDGKIIQIDKTEKYRLKD